MPRFSGRLHAAFIIFANQREHFFCYTRFCRVVFSVQIILWKKFTLLGRESLFWRESPVEICRSKIRILQKLRITFTRNPRFLSKSVKCLQISRHIRLHAWFSANIVGIILFDPDYNWSENWMDSHTKSEDSSFLG